ncbi:MAG: hypothetical protein ACXABY_04280 [Candidatus Thorarchaeota archaeon]|jgi:hypothetical protein
MECYQVVTSEIRELLRKKISYEEAVKRVAKPMVINENHPAYDSLKDNDNQLDNNHFCVLDGNAWARTIRGFF